MKKLIKIIAAIVLVLFMIGCQTRTVYVPVENVRTEIEIFDRWNKDSVYIHDSIFLAQKGDTVWLEKYKTHYKEKLVRDSIHIIDSIKVDRPYPVIEVREVNRLKNWQILLMCLGAAALGWGSYKLIKFFI